MQPEDLAAGRVRLTNGYGFTDLSDFRLEWQIRADGEPIASGSVDDVSGAPGESVSVPLGYALPSPEPGVEYFLNLSLRWKRAHRLLPADHEAASAQLALPVERDDKFEIAKVNPLVRWTKDEVWSYLGAYDVPYNRLHDQGFPSIGCLPCTTAVRRGEDDRAGRWRGSTKTECGLHGGEGI